MADIFDVYQPLKKYPMQMYLPGFSIGFRNSLIIGDIIDRQNFHSPELTEMKPLNFPDPNQMLLNGFYVWEEETGNRGLSFDLSASGVKLSQTQVARQVFRDNSGCQPPDITHVGGGMRYALRNTICHMGPIPIPYVETLVEKGLYAQHSADKGELVTLQDTPLADVEMIEMYMDPIETLCDPLEDAEKWHKEVNEYTGTCPLQDVAELTLGETMVKNKWDASEADPIADIEYFQELISESTLERDVRRVREIRRTLEFVLRSKDGMFESSLLLQQIADRSFVNHYICDPNNVCDRCDGRGVVFIYQKRFEICAKCEGLGRNPSTEEDKLKHALWSASANSYDTLIKEIHGSRDAKQEKQTETGTQNDQEFIDSEEGEEVGGL